MSSLVVGVGPGVFILAFVWIIAVILTFVFSKAKRPISFLGIAGLGLAFLISVILIFIPRGNLTSTPELELLSPDYLFIWRCALIIFLLLSLIIAIILMITEHLSIPMPAKPLKKVEQKTYFFN